jgi:hypothetical protein
LTQWRTVEGREEGHTPFFLIIWDFVAAFSCARALYDPYDPGVVASPLSAQITGSLPSALPLEFASDIFLAAAGA